LFTLYFAGIIQNNSNGVSCRKGDNMTHTVEAYGYLRLSLEDERATESRSIEYQRDLVTKYAEERGWVLKHCFVDDGYTGTNFDRPDFKKMKSGIEKGDIKCVIVKDLSRFGRNAALMTLELERFNDDFGLRFISISEDIDAESSADYSEIFQIILVLNEMYPRDCSKKIKYSWKTGVSDGKFMFGTPPYGYERGAENPLVMEIDEAAAENVRRIFRMYANGSSMRAIAETLNDEGVLAPRAYYYEKKGKTNPLKESATWGSNTIHQMLENEAYIGVLIQGKRRSVSYKNKKRKQVPMENWFRTENAHEPIIDELTWESVKHRRQEMPRARRNKSGKLGLFSGLIKCGDCGSTLAYTLARDKAYYRCSLYNTNGRQACSPHRVSEEILAEIVLEDIRYQSSLAVLDRDKLIQRIQLSIEASNDEDLHQLMSEKDAVEHKINLNIAATRSLLNDRAKQLIPDKIFQIQTTNLAEELDDLEKQQSDIHSKVIRKRDEEKGISNWLGLIERHVDLPELDRMTVTELIDSIDVYESDDGKRRHLQFRINYRFVGEISETKKDIA